MYQDKRASKRIPINLAASYGVVADMMEVLETTTLNISSGGFCFYTKRELTNGTEVVLCVDLDPKDQISVRVKVAWTKKEDKSNQYLVGAILLESKGKDFKKFIAFYDMINKNC